jgi:hypothetical protein
MVDKKFSSLCSALFFFSVIHEQGLRKVIRYSWEMLTAMRQPIPFLSQGLKRA